MNPDDDAMDDVRALLRSLDHPVPRVTAESLAARAGIPAAGRPRVGPLVRWAAAIALAAGATGVAYALPGSPVPRWVAAFVARFDSGPPARSPAAARPGGSGRGSAGIAIEPGDALVIDFLPTPAGVTLPIARVTLSDGDEVVVRSPSGTATFTSDAGRLVIAASGAPDTVAIEIPRRARRVEIRAADSRVFLKDRERIDTRATRLENGIYEIPLARPPSQNPR